MEYERSEEFYKATGEDVEANTADVEEIVKYESEIGPIEVKSKIFLPEIEEGTEKPESNSAIIFLPGYGVEAGYDSVAELNQSLAKYSNEKTYSISTRTDEIDKSIPSINKLSSLHYEAQAIVNFIKDKGLDKIKLAGYSQGGAKAAEVALIIQQEHPEINIDGGLILYDSTGIAEQSATKLKRNFVKDALLTPPGKKPIRAALDILFTAIKEAGKSNTEFFDRITRDTEAMSGLSAALEQLKIPVVLVQGEKDAVSDINEIIPDADALENDREGYLRDTIFINSPYVRMIIGKRDSRHGMPTYRSDEVAKTALYLLQRFHRKKQSNTPESNQ